MGGLSGDATANRMDGDCKSIAKMWQRNGDCKSMAKWFPGEMRRFCGGGSGRWRDGMRIAWRSWCTWGNDGGLRERGGAVVDMVSRQRRLRKGFLWYEIRLMNGVKRHCVCGMECVKERL